MGAYILRRLLLIIPTLIGIMVVNFTLTQFVPGGPIEQIAAQVRGEGDVLGNLAGATADSAEQLGGDAGYEGARGLPPEFIAQLEKEFGFDKPPVERFFSMMWNYIRFDFGTSWFRSISVMDLVVEKMPVSITLGLWSTLIAYVISIPLGIRKAVRDGSRFDTWTSGVIIMAYAIPAFLFAVILMVLFAGGSYWQIFPLRGLTSDNFADLSVWGKVKDYAWHAALPVIAATISSFRDADAADQEQLPGRDQQAVRDDRAGQGADRTPRPVRPRLPQRDADRDRGVSGDVPGRVLRIKHPDRDDLLAGRAGAPGLRGGGAARLSGDLRHAVCLRPDEPGGRHPVGPDVRLCRSAHRL